MIDDKNKKAESQIQTNQTIEKSHLVPENGKILNLWSKDFLEIYPTDLELKVEHNGSHATFIDVDISIDQGKFIYRMLDKKETFNFHIVRMPSIASNISSIIFYSFTMSEFEIIAESTLLLKNFLPVAKNPFDRMINQTGSKHLLLKQIKKTFNRHQEAFEKCHIIASDIVSKIAAI